MKAYVGIDVAFAKKKYLPISVCFHKYGRLCPILLKSKFAITPDTNQFEVIKSKALTHLENGGEQSRIPHANQLWMLVGFELFQTLCQKWECIEVFPQAIVKTLGAGKIYKSKIEGLIKQLSAISGFTGWPEAISKSCLNDIGFGSFHDKLDAYLSAWVASLNMNEREPIGSPPNDVIWVPLI